MSTANVPDMPDVREDVDLTLRHVSRQFPKDFARAILPPGARVTSATWYDTQVTRRQRRLDRALDIKANGRRRLEHTEWQLRWRADLPFRMYEYHNLIVTALAGELGASVTGENLGDHRAAEEDDRTERVLPVPIHSTVVLLTGPKKPWPKEGSYRTSPDAAPFSGVTFRIDAVYQRTISELEARGSPFWLIFAPLAADADEAAMERVVALLRARAPGRRFKDLAGALLVMADVDKRRRELKNAILQWLDEETVMQSWIYKQGEKKGVEKGLEKSAVQNLKALFLRRTGRQPTPEEAQALARRAREVTSDQLFELADMPADAFLAWLTPR